MRHPTNQIKHDQDLKDSKFVKLYKNIDSPNQNRIMVSKTF